jgi:cytoskeletal protein CcmA (bactofilin family)
LETPYICHCPFPFTPAKPYTIFVILSRSFHPAAGDFEKQTLHRGVFVWKKEDSKPQGSADAVAIPAVPISTPVAFTKPNAVPVANAPLPAAVRSGASISQGIKIKGEVTGSEDLYVDGLVEGKLTLSNGSLTIGPNGTVKADVDAREVFVRGRVDGNIVGHNKIQLFGTGVVSGEVRTERLAIEEGAVLRGKVEAGKAPAKNSDTRAVATAAAKVSFSSGSAAD